MSRQAKCRPDLDHAQTSSLPVVFFVCLSFFSLGLSGLDFAESCGRLLFAQGKVDGVVGLIFMVSFS